MARKRDTLDMKQDRLLYLDQLFPPDGFKLHFALATTYSLDAATLVGCSLALADYDYDADNNPGPQGAIRSLRDMAEKEQLAVFYEPDRLVFPGKEGEIAKDLAPILEAVVFPYQKDSPGVGRLHSKIWLVDYVEEEAGDEGARQHVLRLCVTSRNIGNGGFESDLWVTVEATEFSGDDKQNEGLIALIKHLANNGGLSEGMKAKINELSELVGKAGFSTVDPFSSFEFYSFINGVAKPECLLFDENQDEQYESAVVVSPFLIVRGNNNPLGKLTRRVAKTRILMSTDYGFKQAIDGRKVPDVLKKWECWKPLDVSLSDLEYNTDINRFLPDDTASETPQAEEDAAAEETFSHHAKAYAVKHIDGSGSSLYLGSLNATEAALKENIEVLAMLHSKEDLSKMLFEGMRGASNDAKEWRYIKFTPSDSIFNFETAEEKNEKELREMLLSLAFEAHVETGDNDKFNLVLKAIRFDQKGAYDIQPLLWHGKAKRLSKGASVTFEGMDAASISDFFLVSITKNASVHPLVFKTAVKYTDLDSLFCNNRWDKIEAKYAFTSRPAFLGFLYLFFSHSDTYSMSNVVKKSDASNVWGLGWTDGKAWYEWLLSQSIDSSNFGEAVKRARGWIARMQQADTQQSVEVLELAYQVDEVLKQFEGLSEVQK